MTITAVPRARMAPVDGAAASLGVFLVFAILVGGTIPWRSKAYFEGGLDSVVLIKAAMSVVGLGLAVALSGGRPTRPLRAGPVVFVLLYLACTAIGGWSHGSLIPSAVVAVRVLLLVAAVVVLARAYPPVTLVGSLLAALATFAAVGAITGLGSLGSGRLRGGFPPLHPNEIASTCALIVLWCLWRALTGRDRWVHLVGMAVAFVLLLATGSRTPLVALAVGASILLLHATAVRFSTLVFGLFALPAAIWLLGGTSVLTTLLLRDEGTAGLTTLSNRTIAWQAALAPKDSGWMTWLGGGLTMKRIEVPGQFWNEQILDSSWISALVQGGLLGLGICAAWMIYTAGTAFSSPRDFRALQLALLVYLVARGFLESGLFDASTAFLVLIVVCLASPLPDRGLVRAPSL